MLFQMWFDAIGIEEVVELIRTRPNSLQSVQNLITTASVWKAEKSYDAASDTVSNWKNLFSTNNSDTQITSYTDELRFILDKQQSKELAFILIKTKMIAAGLSIQFFVQLYCRHAAHFSSF